MLYLLYLQTQVTEGGYMLYLLYLQTRVTEGEIHAISAVLTDTGY